MDGFQLSPSPVYTLFSVHWSSSTIRLSWKFLSPDALLVHTSIKLHFSLCLVISQTKHKTTISVHEILSDSTFDYPIILFSISRLLLLVYILNTMNKHGMQPLMDPNLKNVVLQAGKNKLSSTFVFPIILFFYFTVTITSMFHSLMFVYI